MATETEETQVSPWYAKFFEYWRNRNRIGPGRVELADCDFFIVGARRTLRILRPPLKSGWYYENTNERPESINDNFFTRWSRRPHSSGNCRCSFRQSSRLSTTEEQIISDELNRIRTSLCEAEKTGQDIEELEQRVSVNLQKLQVPENKIESVSKGGEDAKTFAETKIGFTPAKDDQQIDEQKIKNKIVKDLERYINVLLEEILDDTVKYIAGAENTLVKEIKKSKKKSCTNTQEREKPQQQAKEESLKPEKFETEPFSANEGSLNDISFSFHANNEKRSVEEDNSDATKKESSRNEGYVNRGFIGSENDPDSLDFYLRRSAGTEAPSLEQLDCIDSGINSVETIEFQPEQEPSLEQSLLQIIDEKLGRAPLSNSWEDLVDQTNKNVPKDSQDRPSKMEEQRETKDTANSEKTRGAEVSANNSDVETRLKSVDISSDNLNGADLKELEETANEPSFEKLRLEFKDKDEASSKGKKETTITKLRERFCANLNDSEKSSLKKSWKENETDEKESRTTPIELEDYRKKWPDLEEAVTSSEQNPRDFVMFRKNRKPTIVFLHGFGSSAEIFEHQLRYFSALGYPCIAPDMLGHGMSSAPDRSRDYHFNKLLRDLDAVLHHYAFKPGQKCVLVAHNYGCSFATALASKYVSSIHQLVLISGGGPTPLAPPSTESAGLCCLRAILAPLLMCGLHRDILYSARGRQHPYCGSEPVEQWPSHMKYILDGMIWPEGDYVFHRRICTPTLLIHGLRDNKVSLVHECQMERAMMKAYLEAIPAAGHTPMTDCPEQLNHMIHCFIDLWKNKKW